MSHNTIGAKIANAFLPHPQHPVSHKKEFEPIKPHDYSEKESLGLLPGQKKVDDKIEYQANLDIQDTKVTIGQHKQHLSQKQKELNRIDLQLNSMGLPQQKRKELEAKKTNIETEIEISKHLVNSLEAKEKFLEQNKNDPTLDPLMQESPLDKFNRSIFADIHDLEKMTHS